MCEYVSLIALIGAFSTKQSVARRASKLRKCYLSHLKKRQKVIDQKLIIINCRRLYVTLPTTNLFLPVVVFFTVDMFTDNSRYSMTVSTLDMMNR